MNDNEEVTPVICIGLVVAIFLLNTGRGLKAIELCKECLIFLRTKASGKENHFGKTIYGAIYSIIFEAYFLLPDYANAIKYGEELLVIYQECGETAEEGKLTITLADIYEGQCKYSEARELYEKAIDIMKETGDREGQAYSYGQFGSMSYRLCEYIKAKEYYEKRLAISIEIGDREGEATVHGSLGKMCYSLGEKDKAKEFLEKALAIRTEIGDRAGEATCYESLGTMFISLGEYDQAKEHLEKAQSILIEIGDRKGEASCYGNLATVFQYLCEHHKAIVVTEKKLAIETEIGDRAGEGGSYINLGVVFSCLGEYDKAKKYLDKALAITIEIGERAGEATVYGNLGNMFHSLGEIDKAEEYYSKALVIRIETGDRAGEATCYGSLGTVFHSLGKYEEAEEYLEKALAYKIKIGDKAGEGSCYRNLGIMLKDLGEYKKAEEFFKKSLTIAVEIGDRDGEASNYLSLGRLFYCVGEHVMAEGNLEKALSISQDTGTAAIEFLCFCDLTLVKLSQEKFQEASDFLYQSINKSEDLRGFLKGNDQLKVSFSDENVFPHDLLRLLFCNAGNPNNALYVEELKRARALADLMAIQYSVEMQISANPQSWIGIENIMKKESNCACLYISYHDQDVFLWILKTSGRIYFRRITVNEENTRARLVSILHGCLAKSFRSVGNLTQEDCEDRSLNGSDQKPKYSLEDVLHFEEDNDDEIKDSEQSLPLLHKITITPVADLLGEPEIIIVPDRSFYQVPFAALTDEGGKHLSETFRIRIVPSLTTLKLIQDSPADYHSQTGALIVGDPDVGRVRYKGDRKTFSPLPCARKEAGMIGELLGVQPLLGQCATKQALLERLHSVSLIHFSAHGNAERGEIALSPLRSTKKIPKEDAYLLTMSDISKVQLRAKLVVLSCCHSGRGQIRAEGVVGIARAFLGSGARSVLVALWAIQDSATEQFMRCFYEHLVRGESASESLHETMKWMRGNGFTKVSEWAPFMLIGDNVTFDLGKLK